MFTSNASTHCSCDSSLSILQFSLLWFVKNCGFCPCGLEIAVFVPMVRNSLLFRPYDLHFFVISVLVVYNSLLFWSIVLK